MTQTAGPPQFEFRIAPELEGGTYANMIGVWHTGHEFTMDFASTLPAEQREGEVVVPARIVARVKLPASLIFDLLRAVNENMTKYEGKFGQIHRPGQEGPLYPPDDLKPGDGQDDNG